MFQSELRQSTVQVGLTGGIGALILLDLDHFGRQRLAWHPAGDKLFEARRTAIGVAGPRDRLLRALAAMN